jgi:hypothetical protein
MFKVNKDFVGLARDLMILCTYIPPCDSKYWNTTQQGYGLEVIDKCLMDLYEEYNEFSFLLCGDLNARTASENFIFLQSDVDDFNVKPETDFPRESRDTEINVFGQQLLELSNMYDMVILNGLKDLCFDGEFTYICRNGSSSVDYFLASYGLIYANFIINLQVDNRTDSDHLPVVCELNFETISIENDKEKSKNKRVEKFCWDKNKENVFIEQLQSEEIKNKLELATERLHDDVNEAILLFTDCLKQASQCMLKRVPWRTSNHYKQANWFDAECKEVKKESKRRLQQFRKTRSAQDREEYIEVKKKYNG